MKMQKKNYKKVNKQIHMMYTNINKQEVGDNLNEKNFKLYGPFL